MGKYKKYKNIKLKLSWRMWNEKLKIPDGSYSASDIPDYFVHILKRQGELNDNSSIRIYVIKIEDRIT